MAVPTKLVVLNVALVSGLGLIVWQGRVRWDEAQAARRTTINVPVKRVTPPLITPAQKPDAVQAAKYADVAAKNPFSKDRNPTVIIEAPKVEAVKPMPSLPVVYGALNLPSGTRAIMAAHAGDASKSVRVGDSVGDFKILALDMRKVTFEWEGKQLEKNLDDLVDRSGGSAAATAAPTAGRGPAAPAPPAAAPTSKALGAETGSSDAPSRACVAGDNSPAGTVVDGYKKTGIDSPFGLMGCKWVPVK